MWHVAIYIRVSTACMLTYALCLPPTHSVGLAVYETSSLVSPIRVQRQYEAFLGRKKKKKQDMVWCSRVLVDDWIRQLQGYCSKQTSTAPWISQNSFQENSLTAPRCASWRLQETAQGVGQHSEGRAEENNSGWRSSWPTQWAFGQSGSTVQDLDLEGAAVLPPALDEVRGCREGSRPLAVRKKISRMPHAWE